jgi:hypothetical protein
MTNAISSLVQTVSSYANAAVSNLLYDFSIPLQLVGIIQNVIAGTQNSPNVPVVPTSRAPREWYSQPAASAQGSPPLVTVFFCDGTHAALDVNGKALLGAASAGPILATLAGLLDPALCTFQSIQWADALFPLGASISQGVQQLKDAILQLSTPFILVGYSQGAGVASLVLQEILTGDMQEYQPLLLAGVTFGNICRQEGKVAPVQTDPGGHGLWGNHLLNDTPDWWWDFANTLDAATTVTDDAYGLDVQAIAELLSVGYYGAEGLEQFISNNILNLPTDIPENLEAIWDFVLLALNALGIYKGALTNPNFNPHAEYATIPPPGSTSALTSVQLGARYINETADQWQAQYRFVPPVECLTVNLKLPLSVGQLGFKALRVPCTITAWYQDRNGNWIQLTDGNNIPISLQMSYSATTSWYTYSTDIYPIIGTAVQLRLTRNYDPQMGNSPYVVGIKEMLIRRNVYELQDTSIAIADSTDILGNVITSYVKNWGPANAIDNDPTTYWKSFPCPDPQGVVAFYLDTRAPNGDPQLIDTVYIDPVYTGNTLNLYYSNDPTQGTLIINPVNLPPDIQVNSAWVAGTGLYDTSDPDTAKSQMLFPTSFGPLSQQPIWIGIEWTPNFAPGDGPAYDPILWGVNPIVNTIQMITILGDPTSGTISLGDSTSDFTSNIPLNASASAVATALAGLASIGSTSNVFVQGNDGGPWEVEFIGTLSGQSIPALTTLNALEGGSSPSVEVDVEVVGITPSYLNGSTYWPSRIYYDVGAGRIVCEFTNGTTTYDGFYQTLDPSFTQNDPIQIVVGWDYNPSVVFISVTQNGVTSLGSTTFTSATELPDLITLDGESGYTGFSGLMTAIVIKQDNWSNGYQNFQHGASIYANPNPVRPDANGNYPSTSLDNAILACDWTTQSLPVGGTSESWYESKTWSPIYANYFTSKGNLFLPQATLMSYLKMEFTNLTPEPYPVYDQGISVSYDTFPVSVTQQVTTPAGGLIGDVQNGINTLLTIGSTIVTNTIGGVNWFNPQTIQNAVNANFGVTQQPVQVVSGPGTLSATTPNVSQSNISASYRSESSSPWIYSRPMQNAASLAGQNLATVGNSASVQTMQSATAPVQSQVAGSFTPATTTSTSNVLPQQGSDWWLFPGANFQLPAAVMQLVTGIASTAGAVASAVGSAISSAANEIGTILYKPPSTATRVRFTGNIVHQYQTNTLQLTSAVAYFAGLTEVQAYATSYIEGNDPPSFSYNRYSEPTFHYGPDSSADINQLDSGPVTTAGSPYVFENPNFLYPQKLNPWLPDGAASFPALFPFSLGDGGGSFPDQFPFNLEAGSSSWYWSPSGGLGFLSGQSCAALNADGFPHSLASEPIAVSPGDEIVISAWVSYEDLVSTSNVGTAEFPFDFPASLGATGEISISGIAYDGNTPTPVAFAMPGTTASHTVTTQSAMLALTGLTPGSTPPPSCTITTGQYQGTYVLTASPATSFANWEQTGYGTLILEPTGAPDGNLYVQLLGTYTVPGSGVDHLAVSLNVNSGVTAGTVFFNNVAMTPAAGIEGLIALDVQTTSTFANVGINVTDSGLLNSDSMWAQLDPLDTSISSLQLAPYVATYPANVPSGEWADSLATWDDPDIDWGQSLGAVAITVDPNLIYNGNRALHFTRAAGSGDAGVIVTQQTNMMGDELVQLGCTFYKPTANDNQILILLRRVSDQVVIHQELFTPPYIGVWYTYQSAFFELPTTTDQVYTIEFYLQGSEVDEIYLSNLFCNVAGIRYILQVGDSGAPSLEVTTLVYANNANVSVTEPTNQFGLSVQIYNSNCFAYGIELTPRYLK